MEMDYKTNLENLIAAAYLSGAAEALNKSKELTPEDLIKNLDDLKILRRIFLKRAEEEGYHEPVHHIEEAKKKAFELLTQKTKYPNTKINNIKNVKNTNLKTPNVSNVKTANVSNVKTTNVSNVKTPNVSNVKTPNVSNVKTPNVSNIKTFNINTPNVSNVKTPNISNVKTPTFFNTNVSKAVNAVVNTHPPPTSYTPPVLSLGGKRKI